ncbi:MULTISPECIES: dephospho-CoA kinase [Bacillaceae]|uniref:Dephospho-CoA kinase n=1 Tax=Peribacillus huizhouensis TaxID=1501239 RepID=A0ABR6CM99_9BACI|nr:MULTISPECIES: dephospho-CoA kinase [Bacillaceae]MBA9025851.1 dephospho-CoA kinase [Peribacillus huizhouensis]
MRQVIGITGGIASGKSSISQFIQEELGFTIIDADIAAREVVEPGQDAYQEIIQVFGNELLLPDTSIDRAKLGGIIFHDEKKRLQLNNIVHPAVRKRMLKQKETAFDLGEQVIFMDIPLLFESNLTHMVDKTILIYVDEQIQLERLMKRNGLSEADAKARIDSQMPLAEKKELADVVINNNGSLLEAQKQVKQVLVEWEVIEA